MGTIDKRDVTRPQAADPSGPQGTEDRAALVRFILSRLRSAEDARDLAQETYLRFLQVPDAAVIRQPLRYLYRIALNLVYEFSLRRDRSIVTFDSQVADEQAARMPPESGAEPGQELATAEQLDRILNQIPPHYRRVLVMHKRDGLSYAQIAAETGLSKQSVQKYLARAIAAARMAKWD
jgi:RNA polymerase sigma factor (sigma-70 family)